jgi:hypothetical protein
MSDFPKGRWFPGKSGSMYRLRKKGTKKKKKKKRQTQKAQFRKKSKY